MEKTYWVLLVGKGEGCDYTIGCNKTWDKIVCNPEQLKARVKDFVSQYHSGFEQKIEKVEVLEVVNQINYSNIVNEIDSERVSDKKLKMETEEKKKLAELLAKYGG